MHNYIFDYATEAMEDAKDKQSRYKIVLEPIRIEDGIKLEIKRSKRLEMNWRRQSSCSQTWTNYTIRIMNLALSLLISKAKMKIGCVT